MAYDPPQHASTFSINQDLQRAARGARGAAQSLSEHTCRSPRWRAPRDTSPTMLQALVEAALHGQDQRLVARCDVGGIVTAFEDFGVYDPDMLRSTLHACLGLHLGLRLGLRLSTSISTRGGA